MTYALLTRQMFYQLSYRGSSAVHALEVGNVELAALLALITSV